MHNWCWKVSGDLRAQSLFGRNLAGLDVRERHSSRTADASALTVARAPLQERADGVLTLTIDDDDASYRLYGRAAQFSPAMSTRENAHACSVTNLISVSTTWPFERRLATHAETVCWKFVLRKSSAPTKVRVVKGVSIVESRSTSMTGVCRSSRKTTRVKSRMLEPRRQQAWPSEAPTALTRTLTTVKNSRVQVWRVREWQIPVDTSTLARLGSVLRRGAEAPLVASIERQHYARLVDELEMTHGIQLREKWAKIEKDGKLARRIADTVVRQCEGVQIRQPNFLAFEMM